MDYYIFRNSDKVLLYEAHTEWQFVNEKVACLWNEGGTVADYVYVTSTAPKPPGTVATLDPNGQVVFAPNPRLVAKRAAKEAARVRLTGLGFTPNEINALL